MVNLGVASVMYMGLVVSLVAGRLVNEAQLSQNNAGEDALIGVSNEASQNSEGNDCSDRESSKDPAITTTNEDGIELGSGCGGYPAGSKECRKCCSSWASRCKEGCTEEKYPDPLNRNYCRAQCNESEFRCQEDCK